MLVGLSLELSLYRLVCLVLFFLQNYCSWIVSADEVVIAFWFLMVGLGGFVLVVLVLLGPGCLVQLLADFCVCGSVVNEKKNLFIKK